MDDSAVMTDDSECRIELTLPLRPEFVSIARLTVSGVANRVGFNIETIEDIKVAVAEVCNRIVSTGCGSSGNYRVVFGIGTGELVITFQSQVKGLECIFTDDADDLGLSIMNAFMDKVEFCPTGTYILSMTKFLKGISGDGE